MKVKQLIKELKKLPQDLEVYYSHNDNPEHELAGDIISADHIIKSELNLSIIIEKEDIYNFDLLPEEWVILKG